MMLMGVSWYAYIVSSMSTIMSSFDRQNKAVKEKMHAVNAFIHDAKLPPNISKQIRRYYDFAFSSSKNKSLLQSSQYDADIILDELSSGLRAEVLLFVEQDLIEQIPFFKDKIPQFVADCITMFQPAVFQEGDFIVKEGSAADEMYVPRAMVSASEATPRRSVLLRRKRASGGVGGGTSGARSERKEGVEFCGGSWRARGREGNARSEDMSFCGGSGRARVREREHKIRVLRSLLPRNWARAHRSSVPLRQNRTTSLGGCRGEIPRP
jgi:hypothetical protein